MSVCNFLRVAKALELLDGVESLARENERTKWSFTSQECVLGGGAGAVVEESRVVLQEKVRSRDKECRRKE